MVTYSTLVNCDFSQISLNLMVLHPHMVELCLESSVPSNQLNHIFYKRENPCFFMWPIRFLNGLLSHFVGTCFFFLHFYHSVCLSSRFVAYEAHVEEQRQIHRFSLRERLRQNRVTWWEVLGHGKGCVRPRLSYTPYMSLENL